MSIYRKELPLEDCSEQLLADILAARFDVDPIVASMAAYWVWRSKGPQHWPWHFRCNKGNRESLPDVTISDVDHKRVIENYEHNINTHRFDGARTLLPPKRYRG